MATSWTVVVLSLASISLCVCATSTETITKEMTKRCLNKITSCQLRRECLCTVTDGRCPCCKDCRTCLGNKLWNECRGVANLNPNVTTAPKPYNKVVVGSLDMPMPDLFVTTCKHAGELRVPIDVHNITETDKIGIVEMNCTFAAWKCCMTLEKCMARCKELGATRFRWHPDCRSSSSVRCGCCECEGSGCIREIDDREPKCKACFPSVDIAEMEDECRSNTIPTGN